MSKGMEMVYEGYGHIIDEEAEKQTELFEGCYVINVPGLRKKEPTLTDVIAAVEEIKEVFNSITGSTDVVVYIQGVGSTKVKATRTEEKDLIILNDEDLEKFVPMWETDKKTVLTELLKRVPKEQLPEPIKKKTEEELRLEAGIREATRLIESIRTTKLVYKLEEQDEEIRKIYSEGCKVNKPVSIARPKYDREDNSNPENYMRIKFVYKDPITDKVLVGYYKRAKEASMQHLRVIAGAMFTPDERRYIQTQVYAEMVNRGIPIVD
jgi:hypothetical protein